MNNKYLDLVLDEERSLYNIRNSEFVNCKFDGPKDGESALKECKNVKIENCYFNLRYPIWHVKKTIINKSIMTENCRAALWYCDNIIINDSKLLGIKVLRECKKRRNGT